MATPGRHAGSYLHEEPFPYADYIAANPDPGKWPEEGCNRGLGVLKEVVTFIEKEGGDRPLTLGLFGRWGTGKTSLLRGLEYYYREIAKQPVVFFEAWRYQNEEKPLVPLLAKIIQVPPFKKRGVVDSVKEVVGVSLVGGADLLLKAFTRGEVKVDISQIEGYWDTFKRISGEAVVELSAYDQGQKKLSDAIGKALHQGNQKFILLIDDLDRCLPERAVALLEALRFHFSIERTVIVLAVDDVILGKYLEDVYRLSNRKVLFEGKEFLQKLVHWAKELPHIPVKCLKDHLGFRDQTDQPAYALFELLDSLPYRAWARLADRYRMTPRESFTYRALEAVLCECYPEAESELRRRPELRETLEEAVRNAPQFLADHPDLDASIKEFLELVKKDKSGYFKNRGQKIASSILERIARGDLG